ncbi:carbohydrate ABC transporter permease [Amycolatopsis pithecellobii]|uniref:ABC transporter permease subunit n=1 Tax=Amycolatopsis pithecellobii TaxID=664692 RepID=A0A6N7Z9X4_9PSEU|nr:carbohydrate ABC transporter permease [Amycolatopsis pithecellobii]MTD58533.1 ABC transporter permease subunit [Amycolatopsis pithecellobii]
MATTLLPRAAALTARRFKRGLLFLVMLLLGVIMLYPLYYMVDSSLRTSAQYQSGSGHSLASWHALFEALPVGQEMANSALITIAALAIIVAVSTSAGFGFAKLRYRGSGAVVAAIIACLMVPVQSIILPEFANLSQAGLVNNYSSAILVYAALGTPFATFLMTVYFRELPDELIEAALLDGLSYRSIFVRIALPMARPAIAAVVVLQFIQIWDDLLVGLLFLQTPEHRTITTGLGVLAAGRVTSLPVLMAGATLSALPAVAVYLLLQRHLVRGLTMGIGK